LKTFKRAETPLYFSSKESFGDIDIIVSMEGFESVSSDEYGYISTYIEEIFKPNETFHNGNIWSFDYKEVQVDFIICSEEDFDSNRHYLAYNDLGNFIGRITQKMGLKYGQEGLWYNHYFKKQKIGKIMISKDYPKIFEFLGFDYNRWLEGFETLEDVFEYVIANKQFDSNMFELQHLNKINRERNAKRKSYMSFLEYIHENHSDKKFFYESDKSIYTDRANKFFPDARMTEQIRELEYKHCKTLYIKSKFSGGVVMLRYGLQGKELGNALRGFKDFINNKICKVVKWRDYNEFILNEPTDIIYETFELFYKKYL